jgi:hypothetical protein
VQCVPALRDPVGQLVELAGQALVGRCQRGDEVPSRPKITVERRGCTVEGVGHPLDPRQPGGPAGADLAHGDVELPEDRGQRCGGPAGRGGHGVEGAHLRARHGKDPQRQHPRRSHPRASFGERRRRLVERGGGAGPIEGGQIARGGSDAFELCRRPQRIGPSPQARLQDEGQPATPEEACTDRRPPEPSPSDPAFPG